MKHHLLLAATAILLLASCSGRGKVQNLAQESLKHSVYEPSALQVEAISEPDSAFGTNYFTKGELKGMLGIMKTVTDTIMHRTHDMTLFNPDDYYVIGLADRQMQASSQLRDMLFTAGRKGPWTGWKVKVDYWAKDHNGQPYHAERWVFTDKEGEQVLHTFDLPLP